MKRTIIAALLAGSALTVAVPATAQPGYGGGARYNQMETLRLERLEERLERGVRSGQITRREAFRIRQDMREIRVLEARYSRNGLSGWERADLDRRVDGLAQRIRFERRDDDRRGDFDRRDRRG